MNEKELQKAKISDEELEKVTGGEKLRILYDTDANGRRYRRYFVFNGDEDKVRDRLYVCPICGSRVHYGTAWRYYCDDCDKSWFLTSYLKPNLHSGVWTEIAEYTYYRVYGSPV